MDLFAQQVKPEEPQVKARPLEIRDLGAAASKGLRQLSSIALAGCCVGVVGLAGGEQGGGGVLLKYCGSVEFWTDAQASRLRFNHGPNLVGKLERHPHIGAGLSARTFAGAAPVRRA